MIQDNDFRTFILTELSRRQAKNSAYSLTAFARDLQMSVQKLSQVLSKKIGLSPTAALKIAGHLDLSEADRKLFILLVSANHARSPKARADAVARLNEMRLNREYRQIEDAEMATLANWHLWAAYLLTDVKGFKADYGWISKRLGLSQQECREAYAQLFERGFLAESETGEWLQTERKLEFAATTSTKEIRSFYRQLLTVAESSIENQPPDVRHVNVGLLPIHESDYADFKSQINDFAKKLLNQYAHKAHGADRVYCLAVELFPLDRKDD